ncbi:MAG: amino acid carrier protein, partial [Stomatobaculum sp.]|nr:amino acid carrier protein [Stomatobaculum sp.]
GTMITFLGSEFTLCNLIVGIIVAFIVALVLFGGIKRIGQVTEKIVPVMAVVYIISTLIVIFANIGQIGHVFGMIFKGAFSAEAALGGAFGITISTSITKGIARGCFSNEAGLGSAPMAHAASSETDPVKQGLYGIFEVFMDTIVICSLTALALLCGTLGAGLTLDWGGSAGTANVAAAFSSVFGSQIGSLLIAVGITLFALSTVLSWSLYGTRCFEYLFGLQYVKIYQVAFIIIVVIGSTLELSLVWNIADTLNGFMAIPNLIALLGLSGVVIQLTKEHFSDPAKMAHDEE